jgi:hypothetical protein
MIDLFLRRVSAHVDDHSENASCVFAAKSLIPTKKPASPIRGAGSVETFCGFLVLDIQATTRNRASTLPLLRQRKRPVKANR